MSTKCSIRLNGKKKVSLYFGNSTPFVLEGKVINPPYCDWKADYLSGKLFDIKEAFTTKGKQFFSADYCGLRAYDLNKRLMQFLYECNNVIFKHEFKTAKEIATFVLGGCKEESLNPKITFADFLDIMINDQKEKADNPNSNNFQVYITLKNSLKNWDRFNSVISDLRQSDFENLSTYLKNRKGKNGKKGANFERMLQCYRAVINAAISTRYNKITGCNDSNKVKTDKQNPTTQLKQRSGKSIVELFNEKELEGALSFEQVEAFMNVDLYSLDVKIPTWHNRKKYEYTAKMKDIELWYDILKFMLACGGLRPIDAIRFKLKDIDLEHNRIAYLPHKLNRFSNDDRDIQKHSVPIPLNAENLEIINKYTGTNANGFLFPCTCNIADNGTYNYKRINQVEQCMNVLLKEIGVAIGLTFKPTNYTIRKTAITCNADNDFKQLKIAAMEKAAKLGGTSVRYVKDTYWKPYINNV